MRKTPFLILCMLILFFGIRMSSCSTPKTIPPAEIVEMPTKELHEGRVLFNEYCATCHPEAKAGLGPSIINKPLPEFLIKFQIRNGVGVMPAFNEEVLSDEQVEKIAEYLVHIRKKN